VFVLELRNRSYYNHNLFFSCLCDISLHLIFILIFVLSYLKPDSFIISFFTSNFIISNRNIYQYQFDDNSYKQLNNNSYKEKRTNVLSTEPLNVTKTCNPLDASPCNP